MYNLEAEVSFVTTLVHKLDYRLGRSFRWRGWGFETRWPIPTCTVGEITSYALSMSLGGTVRAYPFGSGGGSDDAWVRRCLSGVVAGGPLPVNVPDYPIDRVSREIHEIPELTAYLAALKAYHSEVQSLQS